MLALRGAYDQRTWADINSLPRRPGILCTMAKHPVRPHLRNGKPVSGHERRSQRAAKPPSVGDSGKQASAAAASAATTAETASDRDHKRHLGVIRGAVKMAREHADACNELRERWPKKANFTGADVPIGTMRKDHFEHAVINANMAAQQAEAEAGRVGQKSSIEDVSAVVRSLERTASGWREAAEEIAVHSTPNVSPSYAREANDLSAVKDPSVQLRTATEQLLADNDAPSLAQIADAVASVEEVGLLRLTKAAELVCDAHHGSNAGIEPNRAVEITDALHKTGIFGRDPRADYLHGLAARKAGDVAQRTMIGTPDNMPDEEKHQLVAQAVEDSSCGAELTRGEMWNIAGTTVYGSPLIAAQKLYDSGALKHKNSDA